ncbi:MAG: YqaE/Pmp3 family membrane protein [Chitinophagaceae bacterium]|nr:YqaE/Pmp3 family membrane protein [Chitinophagaceae bacterium]
MRKKWLFLCLAFIQLTVSFAALPVVKSKNDTSSAYLSKDDEKMVKNAVKAFRSLSKEEKKSRMTEAKMMLKEYKAAKVNEDADTNTVLLAILAILLPPLAVYLHEKTINTKFWISLILSLLFWLPGVIYALIVVLS